MPVNVHSGTGNPDYGPYPVSMLLYINEVPLLLAAPVRAADAVGRVRALPPPQVRDDRGRAARGCRRCSSGSTARSPASATPARPGRSATAPSTSCPRSATEYFQPELWMGVSNPGPADVDGPRRRSASTGSCGAATTRTTRARHPYTREHLRARFSDVDPAEVRQDALGERRRALRLRPRRAGPAGREDRPDGRRGRHARSTPSPTKTLERLSGDMDPKAIK